MTSENEMLPMPKGSCASDMCWDAEIYTANQMHAYASANMELLLAEIERLRAELDEQCRLHAIGMERELKLINERDRLLKESLVLNERAERLAKALQEAYRQVRELCDCYGHAYPEESFVRYDSLLRNQEGGE